MSMMEPFMPHPHEEETVAAADPGAGAPATAPGTGVGGEDPDVVRPGGGDDRSDGATADGDVPFRTPDPDDVGRPAADDGAAGG